MKTKIYAIILSVLILMVGYTLISKKTENKDASKYKNFKVENFEEVSKIRITDRTSNQMTLDNNDGHWFLNNEHPVRKSLFKDLKDALTKMESVNPVSKVATPAALNEMIEHAIKVEVFKKGKKPSKVIYIGGPNFTNSASVMLLEINGKPSKNLYEVSIPGFRGYLTPRFLVDKNEWRSHKIIDYTPNDIKSFSIKYFSKEKKKDFAISKNQTNFDVEIESMSIPLDQVNDMSVANYLMNLQNQHVMRFVFMEENEKQIKDSLLQVKKYAEIDIKDAENKSTHLTIVDMPLNKSSNRQYDENGDPMEYDIDYKYVIFGEKKEWGIISNSKFGALYVSPSIFIK